MNREILFRGKREDNGDWVEGSLHIEYGEIDKDGKQSLDYRILGLRGECRYVIPETVGQYTGLTDKNDKKIFEGDIVKTKKYGKIIGHSNVNDYDIFNVVYKPAVFGLVNHNRGFNFVGNSTDFEVIGNIYDNPELLEAAE